MKWLGILFVSPVWGGVSTQLFLQSWLAFIGVFIGLTGFVKGDVPRKDTALLMGVAAFQAILFSLLLTGGFWLLTDLLPFGRTGAENIVYWIFAGLSALYMLPQIPAKITKSWRNATVVGSLETNILLRRMSKISG